MAGWAGSVLRDPPDLPDLHDLAIRQLIEDPNQLLFGSEIDFDAAARAAADYTHTGAEQELQLVFRRACVNVDGRRRRGCAIRAAAVGGVLDERFGFADRQASRDDVARDAALLAFVGEGE